MGLIFFQVLSMLQERLNSNFVPVQLPIGVGETFNGLIDLVEMKAITYEEASQGVKFFEDEIPADLLENALQYREKLLESVAEFDDGLLEKFLERRGNSPRRDPRCAAPSHHRAKGRARNVRQCVQIQRRPAFARRGAALPAVPSRHRRSQGHATPIPARRRCVPPSTMRLLPGWPLRL